MTPIEKAKEFISKYYDCSKRLYHEDAVICAKIAVEEIIKSSPSLPILGEGGTFGEDIYLSSKYWKEVKQELEKL